MEKRKTIWCTIWLLSFFGVFGLCIGLRSSTLAGGFILAGIVLAIVAQIVLGSATWAATPQSIGYSRGTHPGFISTTIMRETGKERYMQGEKNYEWSIGFGLTITGFLLFLAGLLASAYI
ncbi:MAG: hypothetical protein N3F63_07065 [Thermoplasmata archaeon]|nr:hypothetical protein [Thermoplasmata archaeon]